MTYPFRFMIVHSGAVVDDLIGSDEVNEAFALSTDNANVQTIYDPNRCIYVYRPVSATKPTS